MVFKVTIAIDGMVPAQPLGPMVFDGFHSVNHWWRCFSMVANHWSNDAMVTIHRSGLDPYNHTYSESSWHIPSNDDNDKDTHKDKDKDRENFQEESLPL